jgi:hypothetical protein
MESGGLGKDNIMPNRVEELISALGLTPHPEGGWFRETYRSAMSSSIYYLLGKGQFSAIHRIASDEIWHFHEGGNLRIVAIAPDGNKHEWILGKASESAMPQVVVPAGWWFAAELTAESGNAGDYALAGCAVSPAFEYKDFELGGREQLLKAYPAHGIDILKLTH